MFLLPLLKPVCTQRVLVERASYRWELYVRASHRQGIFWQSLPCVPQAHEWIKGLIYLANLSADAKTLQVVLKSAKKEDSNLAREIHHHRQFLHPHIARLYEVIVTENLVWLVLEYCPGPTNIYGFLLPLLNFYKGMNYTITCFAMAQYRWRRFRKYLRSSSAPLPMYTICPVFTAI